MSLTVHGSYLVSKNGTIGEPEKLFTTSSGLNSTTNCKSDPALHTAWGCLHFSKLSV